MPMSWWCIHKGLTHNDVKNSSWINQRLVTWHSADEACLATFAQLQLTCSTPKFHQCSTEGTPFCWWFPAARRYRWTNEAFIALFASWLGCGIFRYSSFMIPLCCFVHEQKCSSTGYCCSDKSHGQWISPGPPDISNNVSTQPSHSQLHASTWPPCTHTYALSRMGARQLLLHLQYPPFAFSHVIDQVIAWLVKTNQIKSYSIVPSLIVQRKVSNSDIMGHGRYWRMKTGWTGLKSFWWQKSKGCHSKKWNFACPTWWPRSVSINSTLFIRCWLCMKHVTFYFITQWKDPKSQGTMSRYIHLL
jgi:hypothetical protein